MSTVSSSRNTLLQEEKIIKVAAIAAYLFFSSVGPETTSSPDMQKTLYPKHLPALSVDTLGQRIQNDPTIKNDIKSILDDQGEQ